WSCSSTARRPRAPRATTPAESRRGQAGSLRMRRAPASCRALLMSRLALSCSLVIAVACAGCGPDPPPNPAAPTRYYGGVGFLRVPDVRALLLRGMNLAGEHKQAPYFSFQMLPDYQRVRDAWGMNAVRFLITWAAVEPEEGVYDDAYLDKVA